MKHREGKMAKYDAKEIADDAMDVFKMIDKDMDLPEWLEAKITKSADYMNSVKDYLTHHMKEGFASDAQRRAAFASGYKAKGKKKKKESVNEAPQIKKVKNVSVQYFGAEYVGEMTFSGYFRKAWLYKKDNGEWFAVVITKSKNRYEIQLGKHKDKAGADKAAEKIIKRNLNKFESVNEKRGTCWVGYQQIGMKKKGGKMVPNCVKEITEIYYEIDGKPYGYTFEYINDKKINEAEYQGRKVKLGKIMQGDVKKFKVYVKNPKGNVVKVNFGQGGDAKGGTMRIRKSNPKARKSFRARHNCDNPGPKHKARYWSCRKW